MQFEFPYREEVLELTDETRQGAPGEFMQLTNGQTHYQLEGPNDGPVVVLVHGFSVPLYIWDGTYEALVTAGCRVLRYDLFGRGWSDRPFGRYDLAMFERQLKELLDALLPGQPVGLCGLSMGGLIVAGFGANNPQRVSRMALIDPAGFPLGYSWAYRLAKIPGLGELALSILRSPDLERSIASDFFDPQLVQRFIERYRPQMQYKGFRRGILSTLRSGILEDGLPLYESVGQLNLPAFLIWGRDDQTVPFKYHHDVLAAIPGAAFFPVESAGHLPQVEQPMQVNSALTTFFSGR